MQYEDEVVELPVLKQRQLLVIQKCRNPGDPTGSSISAVHVPMATQRWVLTINRIQRITSSTKVQHSGETVGFRVAMRDKFTTESTHLSAYEHLADILRVTVPRIR